MSIAPGQYHHNLETREPRVLHFCRLPLLTGIAVLYVNSGYQMFDRVLKSTDMDLYMTSFVSINSCWQTSDG